MNRFRLYAMPTKPETIDGMGHQRFSRVTPEYSLVYTDGEAPHGSAELKEEDAVRLTPADEEWLLSCNLTLITEEIERQKPEMLRKLAEKVDSLEALLTELSKDEADGEEAEK